MERRRGAPCTTCNFVTYFHASVRDIRGYMFLSDIRGGGGKVS